MSQGEGAAASGPSWLPGRAGHPAAVGGWRSSAADHQPGPELRLWPVSLTLSVQGLDTGWSKGPVCTLWHLWHGNPTLNYYAVNI